MKFYNCFPLAVAFGLFILGLQSAALGDDTNSEAHFISVLQTPPQEKDAACVWLKRNGTPQSVPALGALLNDEQLSQSARYALESMPGPEAENALVAALAQTSGLLKMGVISSLGVRRDPAAVPELAKLLSDPDVQIASVSATALGEIAEGGALAALENQLQNSAASAPDAIADGCLRCAQHLLKAGTPQAAYSVFEEVYQRQTKEYFHVAAFRGMALAAGEHGVDLMTDAITQGPASIQMAAIQLVHEKEFPAATETFAKLLPKADSLLQIALIDALSQRDDPAAAPEIAVLAKQSAAEVRVGALAALGNLGDDKDIPLLIEIAALPGDTARPAARQALVRLHRGTPDQALLDLLSVSKTEAQVEIIQTLNKRGAAEAIPQLLRLARQADDPVREATLQALGRLVDQEQLAALVQIVSQMSADAGRGSVAKAVGAACRHIQARRGTVDLTPVLATLKNGSTETRIALLPVCSGMAEAPVRAILRSSIADPDPGVHAAAVRALCNTMDAALVPDVAKIACDPSEAEFRTLAIESCVRLTTQEENITIPDPERIKFFQAIMPVAASADEKRLVLSGLAALPGDGALQLAKPFLSDVTVSNEAAWAVIGICRKLPDTAAAKTALEDLVQRTTSDQIRQEAQAVLKLVDARADYITAWEIAGPYRQAGQNFSNLFDIVFLPETANAGGANWRDIPLSNDPKSPWAIDLLKAIGGEQEVAYARTSIHSDIEQSVWLLVNSDDGVKAWLNDAVIHANNISRALTVPADKIKITLKPGWNNLLLKITQNTQGWGFGARLTNLDGSRLTGVQYATHLARPPM